MSGVNMQDETAADPAKPKKKRKIFRWIFLFILLYPFLSIGLLYLIGPPKLIISKETTGLDNPPLTANGMVDCLKYFNDTNSKGVTPENNFINAWVDIVGVDKLLVSGSVQDKYLNAIGYEASNGRQGCFVSLSKFQTETGCEIDYDVLDSCKDKTWTAAQHPEVARYLQSNAEAIDRTQKALARSFCYTPFIHVGGEMFFTPILTIYNSFREMAKVMSYRAALEMGEKKTPEAFRDIIAIRKLALKSCMNDKMQYDSLIPYLVGLAVENLADGSAFLFLSTQPMTAQQARDFLAEWRKHRSFEPDYAKIMFFEKVLVTNMAIKLQKYRKYSDFLALANRKSKNSLGASLLAPLTIGNADMNYVTRRINSSFDILEKALSQPVYLTAGKNPFTKYDALLQSCEAGLKWDDIFLLWMPPNIQRLGMSEIATRIVIDVIHPQMDKVPTLFAIERAKYDLVDIGLALREYQLTKGGYPEKLAELIPGYFKELPKDPFSGKDYIYKQTKDGFKLYSINQNFKDDGGVVIEDHPREGDIVLEIPIPEKTVKK